jgi:uncharacterized RDD family membrane protein YckC
MSGSSTPAGWYPDPSSPGQQRYWDGTAWTDNTAPGAGAAPTAPPVPPVGAYAPPGGGYASPTPVGYGYAQGVGAEPASFFARLGAYLLDALIIGVPFAIVFQVAYAISEPLGWIVYIIGLAGIIYYFGRFEGGPDGQTIGKKQLGIRVVDADTLQPGIGMGRGIGRYFARIPSSICALGYLWMLWDPQKQTWHDKIVRTKVVKG